MNNLNKATTSMETIVKNKPRAKAKHGHKLARKTRQPKLASRTAAASGKHPKLVPGKSLEQIRLDAVRQLRAMGVLI